MIIICPLENDFFIQTSLKQIKNEKSINIDIENYGVLKTYRFDHKVIIVELRIPC